MKRILALLCALLMCAPAYASNISLEPLLNNCYDSTHQALKAKISGRVSGDSITASQVIIQPQTGFGRTSFQVISSDGTTTLIISRDSVGIGTALPLTKLEVIGYVSGDGVRFDMQSASPDTTTLQGPGLYVDSTTGRLRFYNPVTLTWQTVTLE